MRVFLKSLTIFMYLITCWVSWGESLWTPGFQGYLSSEASVREGDVVFVRVDADSRLSYSATSNDSKNITLEFAGGDYGNLFSFLPVITARGDSRLEGEEAFALQALIGVRVAEIDAAGKARIAGTQSTSVAGNNETVSVSGWLDPRDLGPGRVVDFSRLADARLSFSTFMQSPNQTLTNRDIEEILRTLQETSPPQPGAELESTLQTAETAGQRSYQLSEAKKRELLLRYINRMVDLIFQ
jgi:flagellar L-ring protein precursor FlgH